MQEQSELTEIKLIENEALVDNAITTVQKNMGEMFELREKINRSILDHEIKLGQLLAYKALFGRAQNAKS